MTDKINRIIRQAYSYLDEITPLKYDCGQLCGALCCRDNGESDTSLGMWLLPFEKELLKNEDGYVFKEAQDGTQTVSCSGKCRRNMRPFSCRIYPYYAHLSNENGKTKITIKIDPRARLSCPIARFNSHSRANIYFLACAKAAIRTLLKDEKIAEELYAISDFLSEIEEMQLRFFK